MLEYKNIILNFREVLNMYDEIKKHDKPVYDSIVAEYKRQQNNLELIASENFTSPAIMEAQGSVLTNKYAEGYPGRRYYGGCENVDVTERLAIERAKELFGAEHANVQPHSGTQANIAAYLALINPGDTILGLSLDHGGHLTHGHPLSFSGKYFKVGSILVDKETEMIDYDEAERVAMEVKPKLMMMGASSYSRIFDWKRLREIADKVGAYLVCDIAHYAGLIAVGEYPSPVPYADIVTTTTHKTLRGPRGGLILCKEEHRKAVNRSVFPGNQGGPLEHVIAGKAICFAEALKPEFKVYQQQVKKNAKVLASELEKLGYRIVSGGTDCHVLSVDLRPKKLTGKVAEEALDKAGITVNKNTIPYDPEKPLITSGIRIGTPAITTRGMKDGDMMQVARFIDDALAHHEDENYLAGIQKQVAEFCSKYPLYPNLK